ncbi:hypothetical protein DLAC_07466 [Tieghemostelium lacteum]|uniref:NAD(P)H-hydrate epimerase n=1 Tax=Tieghemostelium lacteum TaxID=361077 RepID=A0A151ZCM6_TIELA|nr:hypothetical protein DLAC_07466 [Tieghemostelium lacteum]|eukprot:KYQ91689.1 hypothetical protein DLAC_07466 [Tieghemostelium lacteum]
MSQPQQQPLLYQQQPQQPYGYNQPGYVVYGNTSEGAHHSDHHHHSKDVTYSIIFFILGFFISCLWLVNIKYLKSHEHSARGFAIASLVLMNKAIKFLTQKESTFMDELLLGPKYGFTSDQLMELAGLSVSSAVLKVYPKSEYRNVLTICGPGNNGGDGLIASRQLVGFGYNVSIYYPKRSSNDIFKRLLLQSELSGVHILSELPENIEDKYNIVIDAIFGYSFNASTGEIRAPFDSVINRLNHINQEKTPIVSVDIPSGWDVDVGNVKNTFVPKLLVSLASPKKCAQSFKGTHYLGGRFLPDAFASQWELNLPPYPGSEQCVDITNCQK